MKRASVALVLGLLPVLYAGADDEIFLRSREKPVKGIIKSESPRGIVLSTKESFAPEEIVDVFYDLPATPEVKFGVYSGARTEERDSLDPAKEVKRKVHLQNAVDKYRDTLAKAKDRTPRRHLQYKIAVLQARQAQEEGAPVDAAIKAIAEFKAANRDGWQIVPAMQMLAQLHLTKGEYKEAASVYDELASYDVSEDDRVAAQIQAATVSIRAKQQDEAMKKLQALAAKLPKGSKHAARAQIAIGECLAAQGKAEEAGALLRGIIAGAGDKSLKAAAHNALGESLMKRELYKEARWEFLRVDLIFNQDRAEHARALYNLARAFDALGEGDRALECKEMLANDRTFAGLEPQRWAQRELAGDKKK